METKNNFILRMSLELFDQLETSTEKAVLMAILSFSSNGKGDCYAGQRRIAARAGCSKGTAAAVINQLAGKGYIEKAGKKKSIGGWTDVLRLSGQPVSAFEAKKDNKNNSCLSGQQMGASGQKTAKKRSVGGYKTIKGNSNTSKNSFEPCTAVELYKVSVELNIAIRSVRRKHLEILEMVESGEMAAKYPKNKTTYHTLRSWLRMGLESGRIQEMTETEQLKNEHEEPARKARFEALKQAAIERGAL